MAVTINWNGDITGLISYPLDSQLGELYRVSERFFSLEELNGCSLFYYQGSTSETLDYSQDVSIEGGEEEGVFQNYLLVPLGTAQFILVLSISDNYDGLERGTYFYTTKRDSVTPGNYVSKLILPNAVDEIKPLVEITYNGETIAQLNAGETAVLKCAELPMVTDITVKVNG